MDADDVEVVPPRAENHPVRCFPGAGFHPGGWAAFCKRLFGIPAKSGVEKRREGAGFGDGDWVGWPDKKRNGAARRKGKVR